MVLGNIQKSNKKPLFMKKKELEPLFLVCRVPVNKTIY